MREEQVFQKVLMKAMRNGYRFAGKIPLSTFGWRELLKSKNMIIFDHEFAQAFWALSNNMCRDHGDLEVDDEENASCQVCGDSNILTFPFSEFGLCLCSSLAYLL